MVIGIREHWTGHKSEKEDFWRKEMNGLREVGASYIYVYTLPVLIRVKMRERKLIRETIRQDPTVKRILDWVGTRRPRF